MTISTAGFGQAQTVTFGQFFQRNGTNDFIFTNQVTSASFQTIADGTAVLFTYQNVANLPPELQGVQLAHVMVTATTTQPAFQFANDPPRDVQQFNQTFYIRVIRDTQAQSGTGTRRNLLTAVITPDGTTKSSIAGDDLSDALGYTATDARQTVTYTSDFIGFLPTSNDNLSLSFSSAFPLLTIGAGGFFNSFTAAGTGTFATSPAPVFNPPTAGGVTISGQVLNGYGRAVSRATVTLNDSSGNRRIASTNNLGYFRFDDITAGQVVTIEVSAKGWTYEPRIVNVVDSISDVEFYPVQ
ncbi:MAG TPA: carboxypeptidase-like regulatory domain-containing protein [Pyrinomonadaceae bacterium]